MCNENKYEYDEYVHDLGSIYMKFIASFMSNTPLFSCIMPGIWEVPETRVDV